MINFESALKNYMQNKSYLDDDNLKEKTEKKFKSSYGISLSSGLALLMTALIEEKIQIFK